MPARSLIESIPSGPAGRWGYRSDGPGGVGAREAKPSGVDQAASPEDDRALANLTPSAKPPGAELPRGDRRGGAVGERHGGPHRVDRGALREDPGVDDPQAPDVVAPAELVDDAARGVPVH